VAATFSVMALQHRQADHAPYIEAVRRDLEVHDIRVTGVHVAVTGDGRREAVLTFRPDEAAFAGQVPEEASARWDEDSGWSVLVRHGPLENRVHKGLGVVPDPGDVAAWAVVLLAHPELTPSYEDHPFRDHCVPDPEFEAQLARYAPGG
jgi:Family of unknown function (DUF6292)